MDIRPFEPSDYLAARALWERCEGIGLSTADEETAIVAYLARNPKLSLVAAAGGQLAGTILCGHDGRRGLIHHLAVAPEHRGRGVGTDLLRLGLAGLHRAGIDKCHLMVVRSNEAGLAFWRKVGAEERTSLSLFSVMTEAGTA